MLDLTQHVDSSILYICLFFSFVQTIVQKMGISQFGLYPALKLSLNSSGRSPLRLSSQITG